MKGRPITIARPRDDGILQVTFDTGNTVTVDMTSRFTGFRFGALQSPEVWNSVDTDGTFVRWYKNGLVVAELAYDEIMKMALGESY